MKHLFLLFLIFISSGIYGQKRVKLIDVYVVTYSNDTLYGKINERYSDDPDFITLPFIFSNGTPREFKPFEIKSFTIGDNSFESLEFGDKPCASCSDKVFIKRYIDGPMILYIYQSSKIAVGGLIMGGPISKCVINYYIRKQQDTKAILAYRQPCDYEILVAVTQPNNYEKFCDYFSDIPDICKKIKEKEYTRKEIELIVSDYNNYINNK
jgi:hypothetical protein